MKQLKDFTITQENALPHIQNKTLALKNSKINSYAFKDCVFDTVYLTNCSIQKEAFTGAKIKNLIIDQIEFDVEWFREGQIENLYLSNNLEIFFDLCSDIKIKNTYVPDEEIANYLTDLFFFNSNLILEESMETLFNLNLLTLKEYNTFLKKPEEEYYPVKNIYHLSGEER